MLLNINYAEIVIQNLKYPLVFLFKFCLMINSFTDNDASIILKIFYKYHSDLVMILNTKLLFMNCNLYKYDKSINVINTYYSLIQNKLKIIYVIKKWHDIYHNKYFWKLSINEQLNYLNNIKIQFLSVYDCSINTVNIYHIKIAEILKDINCNRSIVIENIKERLKFLLKLFGIHIFEKLEIHIYHSSEFIHLENDLIILYLKSIFHKLLLLINQTICVFNLYQKNCNEINHFLNIEN